MKRRNALTALATGTAWPLAARADAAVLFSAAEAGDIAALKKQLDAGVAVDTRDARRRTAEAWQEQNPGVGAPAWFSELLDPHVLTIGFARRVPTYKRLTLMLHDPEEEHDCFSDNTHNSHYYDGLGIENVYLGRYVRLDGTTMAGPALADLVALVEPDTDARLRSELRASVAALAALKAAGDGGMPYDQMIAPGNAAGEALVMAGVDALVVQTASIGRAVAALGLQAVTFEGEGLDAPDAADAVFQ